MACAEGLQLGLKTSLNQLRGLALVDECSSPAVVRLFPVSRLPGNIVDAFKTLFKLRDKWILDEILPYIETTEKSLDENGEKKNVMKKLYGKAQKEEGSWARAWDRRGRKEDYVKIGE
ncbi:unnamed protein product [Darwinula stevensoni]|uniref:Sister chromatid cohesion protein DCC1 n=1 Tax=Darwinula stevensoni TaxID=69355 RepID=A0A7R9AEK8_9CRUS|nr:unnamed protein product [Darwinula stevensoni]CAG0902136.1 unnamed protein product [Darwinula stevensoni]